MVQNNKVLVVGFGKSGTAAAALLEEKGADVILYDSNEMKSVQEVQEKLPAGFHGQMIAGVLPEEIKTGLSLVVLSPGVPTDIPMVNELRDAGVPIWGEIELAYRFGKGKIIAVTGTNGKTTTTALTGEIMKTWYQSVFVVGNIGDPYTLEVDKMGEDSVTVAEISSFQLETIHKFRPDVSAILNITPDHLNRHHTMENYIDAKLSITRNQTKEQVCVLNYEDEVLQKKAAEIPAKVVFFSSRRTLRDGICLIGDEICLCRAGTSEPLCNIHELRLLGEHNYENVMAAIAMSMHAGVPMDHILKAVKEFRAVEHRIEYVDEINGVKYFNDSKGTNPDAAIKGIQAMPGPTCLIGGGYDKGSSYDEWIEAFDGKVKKLVLLGATRDAIADCARAHGFTDIILTDTLKEAVELCAAHAAPGECVLLSPACASWGMFENYEQRGDLFKEYVNKMKKEE
ncbi:UDP-N-acetylmuramoyl-L-alanine--D-glutamate ligase [Anaerolentibacter hominis]|uniref:UDP-N-acetylmuramoyl-L-alanine--D-glutamate ligase n=1 Tax=Anaerolentibacter hominis TaxID=3079009 RepID=UPI0031B84AC4